MYRRIINPESFLCLILHLAFTHCATSNYGPFQMHINKFDVCAGPRNKNCTVLTPTLAQGGSLNVDVKVLENCNPSKAKILTLSNGKELMRLQMNKPCEHLFLRPLFESLFSVTKTCTVLKGDYACKLNMEKMVENYFGGKFFYGNLTFKAILFGNDCNFSCTLLHVVLSPK